MKMQGVMVYIIKNGKILFLVRNKKNDTVHKKGYYVSIGGKVEPGERIEDAAIREVMEESGIKVHSLELRGVLYFTRFGQERHDWLDFLYICEDFTGEPHAGDEGSFAWVDRDEIATVPMYEGDYVYLQEMLKNKLIIMEFIYDGHTYKSSKLLKRI